MLKSPLYLPSDIERKVQMARNQSTVTPEIARLVLDCLDLTALSGRESEDDIYRLCHQAITYRLSAMCVLPDKVKIAAQWLKGTDVKVATVINFPYGYQRTNSDDLANVETTAEDVARAIGMGAKQIDIVQPHDIRPGQAQDIIRAARLACPGDVTLKSILETASYKDTYDLANAALITIASGADCITTSSGQHAHGGATLEAAAVLLQTIKHSGRSIGIKISGGIRTAEECAQYIALQRSFFGWNSVKPENFRIGGSSVLDSLLQNLDINREVVSRHHLASANDQFSYQLQ